MATSQDHCQNQEEYSAKESFQPTDNPPYQPMQYVEGDKSRSKSTITHSKGDDLISHRDLTHSPSSPNDQQVALQPSQHSNSDPPNHELVTVASIPPTIKPPSSGNDSNLVAEGDQFSLSNNKPSSESSNENSGCMNESSEKSNSTSSSMSWFYTAKAFAQKYKDKLIAAGLCISLILLAIVFMITAIAVSFKPQQSQEVSTTYLIKLPLYYDFTIPDNKLSYCILVGEIHKFVNGKISLSTNKNIEAKEIILAITKELVIAHLDHAITASLKPDLIGLFKFNFTVNNFYLEIEIETESGGMLNVTLLRSDIYGHEYTLREESILVHDKSVHPRNYGPANESGFYQLNAKGDEGITGMLDIHTSHNVCQSNQLYALNCSIYNNKAACEVDISRSTAHSGYILLILDEYKYDEDVIFNVTTTETIQFQRDNTVRLTMIVFTIICLLLVALIVMIMLLKLKYKCRMLNAANTEQKITYENAPLLLEQ